ncbi:MAG: hypothetical protein M3261_07705 [Thermoproteota archaeon]|nr:hypothetical protein [Thermoproteota archaeon]
MRSLDFSLESSKRHLLILLSSIGAISSLGLLTGEALAASDKFGIEELYPTANDGPVWFLNDEDPEDDDNFLMTSANNIDLEKENDDDDEDDNEREDTDENDQDGDVFKLNAETGTQKHGVRIHADSPVEDEGWKNVEMTGYFKLEKGNDQFTLIARQGPTYNDDGGCGAYGYYGMLSYDGDAFFKKKLFHHGGYTYRTAVEENVVDDLDDRWVGIKMVTYDLGDDNNDDEDEEEDDNNAVKLELWVDDGNEKNNWKKATEYIDDGDWETNGSDCDKDGDEIIDKGTRGGFRVDDSEFEFKDLSIREINGDSEGVEGGGEAAVADAAVNDNQQAVDEEADEQTEEDDGEG